MPVSTPADAVETLWSETIAPQLRLPREVEFARKSQGISTDVHFVHAATSDYVLRIYPASATSRMKGYLEAHALLSSLGMRVAQSVGQGAGPGGSAWIVERKAAGPPVESRLDDPDFLRNAAAALAALHAHQRKWYGDVGKVGGRRLSVRWRQRFPERWAKVTSLFPELAPAAHVVENWFIDWTDRFTTSEYQLLHGDYHPGNLALDDQGEIVLLDLRSPKYGFGLVELVEAAHHFTGEEPSDWEPFASAYLSAAGDQAGELFGKERDGLHAVFHLRHADRFAGLAVGDRGSVDDRRRWERNAFDNWIRFAEIAGVESPALDGERESPFPSR